VQRVCGSGDGDDDCGRGVSMMCDIFWYVNEEAKEGKKEEGVL
jgi:hypothetical protein